MPQTNATTAKGYYENPEDRVVTAGGTPVIDASTGIIYSRPVDAPPGSSGYAAINGGGAGESPVEQFASYPFTVLIESDGTVTTKNITGTLENADVSALVLESVYLGSNVTAIGDAALDLQSALIFASCNSVVSVGQSAFNSATAIERLKLPSATVIGQSAFAGAVALTDIYLACDFSTIDIDAFTETALTTIHLRPSPNTPAGWTIGSGQTIGGKAGVTVVADWTNYPN